MKRPNRLPAHRSPPAQGSGTARAAARPSRPKPPRSARAPQSAVPPAEPTWGTTGLPGSLGAWEPATFYNTIATDFHYEFAQPVNSDLN